MVNPGHPSGACETCKVRRIKCDETRPYCLCCISTGRICVGYRSHRLTSRQFARRQQKNLQWSSERTEASNSYRTGLSTSLLEDSNTFYFFEHFLPSPSEPRSSRIFLDSLRTTLANMDGYDTLRTTLAIIASGYRSLSQPLQTRRERRALLQGYQTVVHATRQRLSSQHISGALIVSVYLLALYEVCRFALVHALDTQCFLLQMTVNVDSNDKVWQIHLSGLLALLKGSGGPPCAHSTTGVTVDTLSIPSAAAQGSDLLNGETAVLVYALQSRLHQLAPELDGIFRSGRRPRKLDVRKIRTAVRNVHKDLLIAGRVLQKAQGCQWISSQPLTQQQPTQDESTSGLRPRTLSSCNGESSLVYSRS